MSHHFSYSIPFVILLSIASVVSADKLPIATLPADRTVVYSKDIAPVLKKNCIACHNASTEEGSVNLESVTKMMSSDVDNLLVPGKPDESLLFLLASHTDEPVMPPSDNDVSASPMNPTELALLRRWIQTGAAVDDAKPKTSMAIWQPLPRDLKTIYGASMTPDGRLLAASFGNTINLFGSKSSEPIAALTTSTDGLISPAHNDFVQDLHIDSFGTRIFSAGFRNVKFWKRSQFGGVSIPEIHQSDVLASVLNSQGTHLATLSRLGEVSVAIVGKKRWEWMKGFDLPAIFQREMPPQVRLTLDESGNTAIAGWNKSLRIAHADRREVELLKLRAEVSALAILNRQQLLAGDNSGGVTFFERQRNSKSEDEPHAAWKSNYQLVSSRPITHLLNTGNRPDLLFAIDADGQLSKWDAKENQFNPSVKLPSAALSASLTTNADAIHFALDSGAIGKYSIAEEKFVEVAGSDPVLKGHYADCQWKALVGEKVLAANETELKAAETALAAEKKNLKKLDEDRQTKLKAYEKQNKLASEAEAAAAATAEKLAVAKESGEGIEAASDAAIKAAKDATAQTEKLAQSLAEVAKLNRTKHLGESRLKVLENEANLQQLQFNKSQVAVEKSKMEEQKAKSELSLSKATDGVLAIIGERSQLLTQSSSGNWCLWSQAGDWLAVLPEMKQCDQVLDSSRDCILVKVKDGSIQAMRPPSSAWQLANQLGAFKGDSPFSDRVLCLDVDASGQFLATGGGSPSRFGELMIWNTSDGSLHRRIETPHSDTVLCVAFSPDGKTLASGSTDKMIKLWDVESGALVKTLEGHTHHVTGVAWNADRRQLASCSADATVKIWDIQTGQSERTIGGLKSEVTKLAFVGAEDRVALISGGGDFRVYRTDNGGRVTNTKIAGGYLYALSADRMGTRFLTGGDVGIATLIEKSGKQLQQLSPTSK